LIFVKITTMKNKLTTIILSITLICSLFISSTKSVQFSSVSPDGYTGATGVYCTNCHADYPLNAAGGNVMLLGLPTGNYVPNATYNLSLKINHFTNDRTRWGFAIKAVNNAGNAVGTFSTTNTNAYINGDEISHFYAITTSSQSSFTYDSLKWTAPATAGNATFYYAGNAANNSAGNDGDYIYSGVSAITLPIYLKDFTANIIDRGVSLYWESTTNNKFDFFEIERSDDGQFFFNVGTVNANNNRSFKYNFIDNKVSPNNQSNVFYRLKSIDKNGDTHYSKTINIQTKNRELVVKNIYPTLVKQNDIINVEISSLQYTTMKTSLIDATGNILQNNDFSLTKGLNKIQLPLTNNCSKGIKFLRFTATNFTQTKTIIVAK